MRQCRRRVLATGFRLIVATALVAVSAVTLGATVEPPGRTLPSHIKRVYIPEFRNESRQFGAQADLTLAVNDEFMSDGRLDVVQNERADVRLEGRIKTFTKTSDGSSGDRIPVISVMTMTCVVEMWDPYDTDRVAPIATYTVPATIQYISDARRSLSETDVDSRERLYRQMAKNIVQVVLTGAPDARRDLEQKAIQKYRERNNPIEREPVMTRPRYARPTPGPASR